VKRETARTGRALVMPVLVVACLATGCATRSASSAAAARQRPTSDQRLVGHWRATTARQADDKPLQADYSTTASLTFRADGVLIANDESCRGAPHFTADGARLTLHWPRRSECYGSMSGTRNAFRIAHIVERLVSQSPIRYSLRGTTTLIVSAGHYRVVLRRGFTPQRPPTIGPSTHVPYPGPPSASSS